MQQLQSIATKFATEHGLDHVCVEQSMHGVLLRVKAAVEKGETLSTDLIEAAFIHWHQQQQKFYEDLLANKDGQLDALSDKVYDQLCLKRRMEKYASFTSDDFICNPISVISNDVVGIFRDDDCIMSVCFSLPLATIKANDAGEAIGIDFSSFRDVAVFADASYTEESYNTEVTAILDELDNIRNTKKQA